MCQYSCECQQLLNDVSLDLMERYSRNGISVRRYNNRVRISVPNCNELTLVMWAICEMRTLDNPDVEGEQLTGKMIKYVVMRGLNFGHRAAHGLLGKLIKREGRRDGEGGREGGRVIELKEGGRNRLGRREGGRQGRKVGRKGEEKEGWREGGGKERVNDRKGESGKVILVDQKKNQPVLLY